MTINTRTARAVRQMRAKLRDLAAAEAGDAQAKMQTAADNVATREQDLEDTLDNAEDALAAATHVYMLDHVHDVVGSHRVAVSDAKEIHTAATKISDLAGARLRARIRQLKTAERVVDLLDEERAQHDARTEQRGHDDLAAARRPRSHTR